MCQLIAAVDVVIPGRQPHIDALHDSMRRPCSITDSDRRHHQNDCRHRKRRAPARHAEHREKYEQRDQRRPQVLQNEKEHDGDARCHQHRQDMFGACDTAAREALFTQIPQTLPDTREVTRQKHDEQNFDQLDGLEDAQIHFCVVARRSAAECHQQTEQSKCGEQRRVTPARQASIVESRERGQGEQ